MREVAWPPPSVTFDFSNEYHCCAFILMRHCCQEAWVQSIAGLPFGTRRQILPTDVSHKSQRWCLRAGMVTGNGCCSAVWETLTLNQSPAFFIALTTRPLGHSPLHCKYSWSHLGRVLRGLQEILGPFSAPKKQRNGTHIFPVMIIYFTGFNPLLE